MKQIVLVPDNFSFGIRTSIEKTLRYALGDTLEHQSETGTLKPQRI